MVASFNQDEWITVRGIPVLKVEVALLERKFGAMLFDESVFQGSYSKQRACANVIVALDWALSKIRLERGDPDYMPEVVDIGDPGWRYHPVGFDFGMNTTDIISKDKPAGLVGWFRSRKVYAKNNGHGRLPF